MPVETLSALGERYPRAAAAIQSAFADSEVRGLQLHVWRDGHVLVDLAEGEAGPDQPMTPETLLMWICAGKPVAAIAVMLLVERGVITLDDAVAGHIPEFARGGKDHIRIREVLSQTVPYEAKDPAAGYEPYGPEVGVKWVCGAPIARAPELLEPRYTGVSNWLVLGEIVRRVDGRPFGAFCREEIFRPLGMDNCWFGIPDDRLADYRGRLGVLQARDSAGRWRRVTDPPGDSRYVGVCWPGNGGRGPYRELANIYKMCLDLGEFNGRQLLSAGTVRFMTTTQVRSRRKERVRFGMGFLTAPRSYGRHAGPRSFGFGGGQASKVFADPDQRMVIALSLNRFIRGEKLRTTVFDAIYEDLGLGQ